METEHPAITAAPESAKPLCRPARLYQEKYSTHHAAALAAWQHATNYKLTDAVKAAGPSHRLGVAQSREFIAKETSISLLKKMCEPGFNWSGGVVTL